jgi:hypothetical protein
MGKHFIDPKSSEILSIFQVFPCTTQIALSRPKLLPALFLKKPWYPCPFEILKEALFNLPPWLIQSFTTDYVIPTEVKESLKTRIRIKNTGT